MASRWGPTFGRSQIRVSVEMSDASAARRHAIDGVFSGIGPTRRLFHAGRLAEMRTDVAGPPARRDRIDQRMEADIAVGMRQKAAAVRHANAADHQMVAVAESVNIVAAAGSDMAKHGAEAGFFCG